jgi:hypothetical protein
MNRQPLSTAPALPFRLGANSPGRQLRSVVAWAVAERERAMGHGWSHLDHRLAKGHLDLLISWLRTNLHPGAETVRAFDARLGASLRYVMPGTAAGAAKLKAYERILFNL